MARLSRKQYDTLRLLSDRPGEWMGAKCLIYDPVQHAYVRLHKSTLGSLLERQYVYWNRSEVGITEYGREALEANL
jgi:hypothetical protein